MVGNNCRHACILSKFKRTFNIWWSTKPLKGHIKDHEYFVDEHKQNVFTTYGSLSDESLKPTKQHQQDFLQSLCLWIVNEGLLFSEVDNTYFKKMVAVLVSAITVTSQNTASRMICDMHEAMCGANTRCGGYQKETNNEYTRCRFSFTGSLVEQGEHPFSCQDALTKGFRPNSRADAAGVINERWCGYTGTEVKNIRDGARSA